MDRDGKDPLKKPQQNFYDWDDIRRKKTGQDEDQYAFVPEPEKSFDEQVFLICACVRACGHAYLQ